MHPFKSTLSGAILLGSVFAAGSAQATIFGGSATFTDITTGNALSVNAFPNPATFTTPNLTATSGSNSKYFTGFMTLTTTDPQGGNGICSFFGCTGVTNTDSIGLKFAWTQPSSATDTAFGGTVAETTFEFAPAFDNGKLTWANDIHTDINGKYAEQLVTFSNGAQALVDVYDTTIDGTTSALAAQFDVRITDVKDPIPEPASMILMGTGLVGMGMIRRKRT